MYKYSKNAEATFLAQPIYSFLFAFFSLTENGLMFAQEQIGSKGDKDPAYLQRMQNELNSLARDAS